MNCLLGDGYAPRPLLSLRRTSCVWWGQACAIPTLSNRKPAHVSLPGSALLLLFYCFDNHMYCVNDYTLSFLEVSATHRSDDKSVVVHAGLSGYTRVRSWCNFEKMQGIAFFCRIHTCIAALTAMQCTYTVYSTTQLYPPQATCATILPSSLGNNQAHSKSHGLAQLLPIS